MKTYVCPSAAILPQSGTAQQGIRNICSLRTAIVAHRKTYVPALSVSPATCQCPRMLETYVRPSAALLRQSGTAPQGIGNICSLRAASPPTGKHTFPHCQCPRPPVSVPGCWKHTFVPAPQFCRNPAQPCKLSKTSVPQIAPRTSNTSHHEHA